MQAFITLQFYGIGIMVGFLRVLTSSFSSHQVLELASALPGTQMGGDGKVEV